MEVVCKSDYQDIYRVKDGVLLVINKFEQVSGHYLGSAKCKRYTYGCQDSLKVLTHDYERQYDDYHIEYKAGQVVYHRYPVELTSKDKWDFQVKTTGTALSGNIGEITMLLNIIIGRILSDDVYEDQESN